MKRNKDLDRLVERDIENLPDASQYCLPGELTPSELPQEFKEHHDRSTWVEREFLPDRLKPKKGESRWDWVMRVNSDPFLRGFHRAHASLTKPGKIEDLIRQRLFLKRVKPHVEEMVKDIKGDLEAANELINEHVMLLQQRNELVAQKNDEIVRLRQQLESRALGAEDSGASSHIFETPGDRPKSAMEAKDE